ncbi:MAG: lamin tail domain-containing protein, partial [Pirellulales bacterium]
IHGDAVAFCATGKDFGSPDFGIENGIRMHDVGTNAFLGEFESGRLNDDGEPIQLEDRFGVVVEQFAYGDAGDWPGRADGLGSSLERIDPEGGHEPANWRASTEYGGSPGAPGSGPVQTATINEVLTASGGADRIELVNSTDHPIDISAWYLSDQIDDLFKFRIPDSTTLAAGQYVVLDESQTGLALDAARAGQLWLMSVDAEGGAIRFADDARFDAAEPGVSLGRWPDGQVNGSLLPMASQTFGQPNSGTLVGPVIVSEVHYNPPEFPVIDKTFDDGTAGGFQPVLGDWTVTDGRYSVMPNDDSPIGDTVAILPEIGVLSSSFRIDATVEIRTDSGAKKNAMIVFDYRSPTDFKFVSLHATVNKLKIGQRDDTGWNFLNVVQLPGVQLLNTDVLLSVEVAGSVARLRLNGAAELTHDFGSPPRGGQVGLATKNGAALFDRVTVHRRNSQEFEFVELLNTTADTLDVSGWQLTGQIAVTLPEGTSLDAGSTLVVVPFDPRIEAVAEDFRRRYGIDQSVALAGPPTGTLDNDTATLRLMRPLGSGGGGLVLVDEVGYDTEPPWPAAADGGGASLGRRSVDARGTVPAGWSGQVPNPGSVVMAEAGDLDGNGKVDAGDIEALVLALRNPTAYEAAYGMAATVAGDIDQDGDVDFDDIAGFLEILLGSSTPASAGTEPVITEFMASNAFSLVDQDGRTSDWIELHNPTALPIPLAGWHLTDAAGELDKWTFAEGELAPGEYAVVFASGKDRGLPEPHTNFKLSARGEYVALVSPSGQVVSEFGPGGTDYPTQRTDVSYGTTPDGARYFPEPTPGAENGTGVVGFVEETVFSVEHGFFDSPFDVEITTSTVGATIHYTLDGSKPTPTEGTVYTGPLTIDTTSTLRAVAFKDEFLQTDVGTQTYIFPDQRV